MVKKKESRSVADKKFLRKFKHEVEYASIMEVTENLQTKNQKEYCLWFNKTRLNDRRRYVWRLIIHANGKIAFRDDTGKSTIQMLGCYISKWLKSLTDTWNMNYPDKQ